MKAYSLLFFLLMLFCQSVNLLSQNDSEPKFIDVYFENREGEKVTQVNLSDEYVYMVIVSENTIGEKFIMTLEEHDGDYIYKKRFLSTGDTVEEKIKADLYKIKLVIYNPNIKKHVKMKRKRYKKVK